MTINVRFIEPNSGPNISTGIVALNTEPNSGPSALQIFELRAWARAYLAYACVLTLPDAVDVLQIDAVRCGLVDEIGQDGVQAILADAFARQGDNVTLAQVAP